MARNGGHPRPRGSLADGDHIEHEVVHSWPCRLWPAHLPSCTQLCRQLLLQHAARLNKETAIDRCEISDASVGVGELLLQPTGEFPPWATIAAQASAPRAIVTPHERQATRLRAQRPLPGAPLGPVCTVALRTAVVSWRSFETSCDPTDGRPQSHGNSSRSSSFNAATALQRGAGAIPPWRATIRWTPVLFLLSSAREMANTLVRSSSSEASSFCFAVKDVTSPSATSLSSKIRRCCVDRFEITPKAAVCTWFVP